MKKEIIKELQAVHKILSSFKPEEEIEDFFDVAVAICLDRAKIKIEKALKATEDELKTLLLEAFREIEEAAEMQEEIWSPFWDVTSQAYERLIKVIETI